jgi:hypothetical protein
VSVLVASTKWLSEQRATAGERVRLSWREELVTGVLGAWMLGGLYLDGWAHRNLEILDTIWTPWHAVFYSGAIVLMSWIGVHVWQNSRDGRRGLAAVPEGYALALVGVGFFVLAGVGDQIWHLTLGIERDLEAFVSPTHMGLAIAIFLMVSSPFRAFWSSTQSESPSFREFAPALVSLTVTVGFVSFLFNYLVMFPSDLPLIDNREFRNGLPDGISRETLDVFTERFRIQGIASVLLTSIIFVGPILLALRRWRLPFGSVTLMFVTIALAVEAVYEMGQGWTILAAAVGGLVADLFIRRWDPSPRNIIPYRTLAAVVPIALWVTYFIVIEIAYGIGWGVEFWAGSIVLSVLVLVWLSLLAAPQRLPFGTRAYPVGEPAPASPPINES